MRRTLLAPLIGAIVILGSMLPVTALGFSAGPGPSATDAVSADSHLQRLRFGCALVFPTPSPAVEPAPDPAPAVRCRWSAAESARVRYYELWRIRDGGQRRLVATIRAGDELRHLDRRVAGGHAYTYGVVARSSTGAKVAVGGPVTVRVPRPDDVLRMACALGAVGDARGVVCKWSEASHPRAARYVLWRSVDGAAREKIYRTGLDGRRWFVDTDVEPGQTIRYAVIVVNRYGHKVGKGGPVVVEIPAAEPKPADLVVSSPR